MSFEYGSFTEADGFCPQTSLSMSHKRVRMVPPSLHSCELFCTIKYVKYLATGLTLGGIPLWL